MHNKRCPGSGTFICLLILPHGLKSRFPASRKNPPLSGDAFIVQLCGLSFRETVHWRLCIVH